jgi:hypothetical protein
LTACGDDPSFGQNGIVEFPQLAPSMNLSAMALGPAGDISLHVPAAAGLGAIARLRADGSPDPNFGEGGVLRFPRENAGNSPVFLKVQPDGKVLVAGTAEGSFVARLILP